MDRNIIMPADVARQRERARDAAQNELAAAAEQHPVLDSVPARTADAVVDASARAVPQTPDTYFDRVLKCVPVEVVGGYTVLAAAAISAFEGSTRRWWLGVLLVLGLIAAPVLAVRLHLIRRPSQVLLVPAAFVVFVAGQGGWFATWSWWNTFYALFAAVAFGVIVALLPFGPLPLPAPPGSRSAVTNWIGGLRTRSPKPPKPAHAPERPRPPAPAGGMSGPPTPAAGPFGPSGPSAPTGPTGTPPTVRRP